MCAVAFRSALLKLVKCVTTTFCTNINSSSGSDHGGGGRRCSSRRCSRRTYMFHLYFFICLDRPTRPVTPQVFVCLLLFRLVALHTIRDYRRYRLHGRGLAGLLYCLLDFIAF